MFLRTFSRQSDVSTSFPLLLLPLNEEVGKQGKKKGGGESLLLQKERERAKACLCLSPFIKQILRGTCLLIQNRDDFPPTRKKRRHTVFRPSPIDCSITRPPRETSLGCRARRRSPFLCPNFPYMAIVKRGADEDPTAQEQNRSSRAKEKRPFGKGALQCTGRQKGRVAIILC